MELLLILWFAFGIIAYVMGAKKGMGCLSGFLGIVLGPIGILIVAMSSAKYVCPYCKEPIKKGATVCPHCRSAL